MLKKLIPFINAENSTEFDVINTAKRYSENGADALYIYNFSSHEADKEEFLSILKKVDEEIDIPFMAGIYVHRFEDAKKAFYTGAEKIVIRFEHACGSDMEDVIKEITDRFGSDNVLIEICGTLDFDKLKFPVSSIMLKHINMDADFENKMKGTNRDIYIRDSLQRNDLATLLDYSIVRAISTDYYKDKNLFELKSGFKEDGIDFEVFSSSITFDELKTNEAGLVPCIVQDYRNKQVLMMAYMNKESFEKTIKTGRMTYFSRSRNELWIKGETSGHYQYVKELYVDCDSDTLLAEVHQVGAACHTGNRTCFYTNIAKKDYKDVNPLSILKEVYDTIYDRKENPREGSYTNYLFDKGIDKILKKCGEEATEIVIAAKNPDSEELKYEISDFLYHMMVLMVDRGVSWEEITRELANRH